MIKGSKQGSLWYSMSKQKKKKKTKHKKKTKKKQYANVLELWVKS